MAKECAVAQVRPGQAGEGPVPRGVLDGGFRVLHALPEADHARQVASLAELTGLPRPTVYRLLGQLRTAGAVQWRQERWELSPALLGLAHRIEPVAGLRVAAAGIVQTLREQTGAAVSLVVATETSYTALEMIPGREDLPLQAHAGAEMPRTTAAALVLDRSSPAAGRRRGVGAAVDREDVLDGVTCYATVVPLPGGQQASLQIATAPQRPAETFAPMVHRAATALRVRLQRGR
jgi:hypothetical protein